MLGDLLILLISLMNSEKQLFSIQIFPNIVFMNWSVNKWIRLLLFSLYIHVNKALCTMQYIVIMIHVYFLTLKQTIFFQI